MMNFEKTTLSQNKTYLDILKETKDEINELKVKYQFVITNRSKENVFSVSLDCFAIDGKMDIFQKIFECNLFDIPSAIYYIKIVQDFKDIKAQISDLLTDEEVK